MSFCVRHHAHTTTTTTAFKSQTTTKTTNFVTAEYLFVSSNSRNRRRKRLVDVSSLREVGGGRCFCRVDKSEASSPDGGRCAHRYRRRRHHHHQQLQIEKYRTRAHLRLTRRIIGMSQPPFHPGGDQPSAIAKTLEIVKREGQEVCLLARRHGYGENVRSRERHRGTRQAGVGCCAE